MLKMIRRIWKYLETKFLLDNYRKMKAKDIAKCLKRSRKAIEHKKLQLRLKSKFKILGKCLICNKKFVDVPSRMKRFCSRKCFYKYQKEHRCIECGKKINPILIYRKRCPYHLNKNKKTKRKQRLTYRF